jgi:hypothetical protein
MKTVNYRMFFDRCLETVFLWKQNSIEFFFTLQYVKT